MNRNSRMLRMAAGQIKNLFILSLFISVAVSCSQAEKKAGKTESAPAAEIEQPIHTVDQVLGSPEIFKDSSIVISGMVTHVCKHGGQKLFIVGDDPSLQLRITVGEGISEFDMALEGSTVEFTGTVMALEEELTAALQKENEEKAHHTGDEPHAKAESASYFVEAIAFTEMPAELELTAEEEE